MRKKWQKVITLALVAAFMMSIFATFPVTSGAAATVFDVDTVIECESVILGKGAVVTKDKKASGGKYITTAGERIDDPSAVANPDMAVQVKIPTDGTYSVYAKVIIPDGGSDSFFFKWDGGDWTDRHPNLRPDWVWLKLADGQLTAGEHIFYWNHRESGAKYDCLFITANASKLPTDLAPNDSGAPASTPKASAAPTAAPSVDYKLKTVNLKDGGAIIEAEDYVVGKTVEVVKSKSAMGKKAVQMAVDDRNAPEAKTEPGIGFEIVADKNGKYNVWVRVMSMSGGSDSCWVGIGDAKYKDTGLGSDSKDEDDYYWIKIGNVSLNSGVGTMFGIIPRETGALMDRIIITNNNTAIPSGEGEVPAGLGADVVKFPEDKYPKPTITPPPEHPRVLFRASDLDTIRANMESEENKAAAEKFEQYAAKECDGILPSTAGKASYNADVLAIIEAKAFDYALNGNTENAKQAIAAIKNYADTCTYEGIHDYTRNMGHILFVAAEVYDWCYPVLTETDKKEIVAKCQGVATGMEIGFPPSGQGAVCGHGGEAQLMRDWLSLAIATYDEYPDIYNFVGGRYLSEFVKTRNYWYTSGTQHQGSAYGMYRYYYDLWGQLLIYKMSGDTVYVPEAGQVPYQWIYTRRGDGQHFREGDDYNESSSTVNIWKGSMTDMLSLAANFYKDPVLKKHLLRDRPSMASFSTGLGSWTPVLCLIVNDPTIGKAELSSLPYTKYFGSPLGQMVARTGWNFGINSPDAIAYMRIGEVWGANHHHKDAGNFQIYYKGILASESGYYESYGTDHDANYNKSSIAHNTLNITSSANPNGTQRNPGGGAEPATYEIWREQTDSYETGEVIGHEFGPDTRVPEYSYLAGDIAKAYDDNVKEAVRSMIFMPTGDSEHPAAFVVFDKVTTDEKTSKKTFMLHMQEEPTVEGNVSIIKREQYGYNGQLTNQTLLPKNATTEVIGGKDKEFWLNGQNHPQQATNDIAGLEDGWGRIEISTTGNKTDYFLNVMYVGDADKKLPVEKAELIEGNGVTGAKIFDRVAMFNNDKERTKNNVSFTVPGSGDVKVNVAGLKEGTWSVTVNGAAIGEQISSKDGGIIYFTAPAGKIELAYVNSNADKSFTTSEAPYDEGVGVKVNKNYISSDVAATIVDGRTLLPMRAIFEALGANVEWDEATATATAKTSETVVKITENQTTAYVNDVAQELDVPATILNGRFVVPVRFVSEALGATVGWDEMSSLVTISVPETVPSKEWDIPNVIKIRSAIQSGDDGSNTIMNSFDGYINTRWAPEGKDGDAWGIYDLGKVYTIDKVFLSYYNGKSRVYYFDIQVSEDGVNYVDVIKGGKSSGTTEDLEEYDMKDVKARYVKYIGGGNTTNLWNSLTEIVLIEKK